MNLRLKHLVALLVLGALLIAGCAGGGGSQPTDSTPPPASGGNGSTDDSDSPRTGGMEDEDGELVVSAFGFGADLVKEHIIDKFAAEYGIKVTVETGTNADRLNKLIANKNNPVVDVVLITDYFGQLGIEAGVFQKVNYDNIPELANVYDFALHPEGYGPIYTVNRLGIVYRTDMVDSAPTSWQDLWDPAYAGVLALPDLNISYGMPFLAATARTFGSGDEDVDAAFDALADVKDNVVKFFGRTSELTSLLQLGEVAVAPAGDIFIIDLLKEGLPVAWTVPDEGSFLIANTVQVVAGTKRPATAEAFINFILSKEVQEAAAKHWYDAPVNKNAQLDDENAQYMAYGIDAFEQYTTIDQSWITANRDAWLDRFMREIAD